MPVKYLRYNWRQSGDSGSDWGEDYDFFEVGNKGVVKIEEHWPNSADNILYYDVYMENGEVHRVFHPNYVTYFKE